MINKNLNVGDEIFLPIFGDSVSVEKHKIIELNDDVIFVEDAIGMAFLSNYLNQISTNIKVYKTEAEAYLSAIETLKRGRKMYNTSFNVSDEIARIEKILMINQLIDNV